MDFFGTTYGLFWASVVGFFWLTVVGFTVFRFDILASAYILSRREILVIPADCRNRIPFAPAPPGSCSTSGAKDISSA